ncbi:MAG TPA: plasmid pRiA4b ORF-3 family protein [Candidatus Obscuribacterales bacterium]
MGNRLKKLLKAAAIENQGLRTGYRLKISLVDSDPPIWRSVDLAGNYELRELHMMIQDMMGWQDQYAHEFRLGKEKYRNPDHVPETDTATFDDEVMLTVLALRKGSRITYEYFFDEGSWLFDIAVDNVFPIESPDTFEPKFDGDGASPPEECGGIGEYYSMLKSFKDKACQHHKDAVESLGKTFDPSVWPDKATFCS